MRGAVTEGHPSCCARACPTSPLAYNFLRSLHTLWCRKIQRWKKSAPPVDRWCIRVYHGLFHARVSSINFLDEHSKHWAICPWRSQAVINASTSISQSEMLRFRKIVHSHCFKFVQLAFKSQRKQNACQTSAAHVSADLRLWSCHHHT